MTEKPRSAGADPAGSAAEDPAAGEANGQTGERVVIRDKRKIDPTGGTRPSDADPATGTGGGRHSAPAEQAGGQADDRPADADPADPAPADGAQPAGTPAGPAPLGAELQALRGELDERTRDLQRVTAEYANYRKRVDRDRGVAAEQTTGAVLTALLPVLDDLDRAREHGDLVGPFATVAEQLSTALGKFGLTAFGEKGDAFDPTRHEAVAHLTSAEVSEATCVEVMRRGYLLGERLLRPALVAVADPE